MLTFETVFRMISVLNPPVKNLKYFRSGSCWRPPAHPSTVLLLGLGGGHDLSTAAALTAPAPILSSSWESTCQVHTQSYQGLRTAPGQSLPRVAGEPPGRDPGDFMGVRSTPVPCCCPTPFHPSCTGRILISHGGFAKTDYALDHKPSLKKCTKTQSVCIVRSHGIKLEMNNKTLEIIQIYGD